MSKKELAGIIARCAVALTLFVLAIVYYDELSTLDIRQLVSASTGTALTIVIILAVYIAKGLVFVVPASLIYLAVGGIFSDNIILGILINIAGIFLEVTATYILGRFLGKKAVYKMLSSKPAGQKILDRNLQDKAAAMFIIRALPVPIDWVSLFYGASGCSYLRYAVLSVLGISIRVVLFTLVGDAIFEYIPMKQIIFVCICLIPVGVVYFLIKKFVLDPRRKQKENEKTAESAGTETAV